MPGQMARKTAGLDCIDMMTSERVTSILKSRREGCQFHQQTAGQTGNLPPRIKLPIMAIGPPNFFCATGRSIRRMGAEGVPKQTFQILQVSNGQAGKWSATEDCRYLQGYCCAAVSANATIGSDAKCPPGLGANQLDERGANMAPPRVYVCGGMDARLRLSQFSSALALLFPFFV